MKKTSNELLQFFGLKVGDKVKVDADSSMYHILKEDEVCEENDKYKHINCWSTISFGSYLISRNYEVITAKKKVGDMKCCSEMACKNCPLRTIGCDINCSTLYDALERYLNSSDIPFFGKAFIDMLKKELDKEVEENL